ncbi:MAG: hypothetical protein ABMA64_39630 [Myxococcota bacterium]
MRALLLGEGNTDRCLLPALRWVLRTATDAAWSVDFVDPSRLGGAPDLASKVLQVEPCDLLFIHRDRDRSTVEQRLAEIATAAPDRLHVPVVPIRMMEAWLLLDERAIRTAAGRPAGKEPLNLPPAGAVERDADPKDTLKAALLKACGSGRARSRFRADAAVYRVADLIEDWAGHRRLEAFQRLETDVAAALSQLSPR